MKEFQRALTAAGWLLALALTQNAQAECDARKSVPASARFVVKDEVVYDKSADLTWKRCSEGQSWSAGAGCQGELRLFNCEQARVTKKDGWRVPTIAELSSLVTKGCRNPAIDDEKFPGTPAGPFWSSTKGESNCWRVDFEYGESYLSNWWDAYHLRLVRNGE